MTITNDKEEGFRFSKLGTMIGSLGYYHLIFDLNMTEIEHAIVAMCSHTDITLQQYEKMSTGLGTEVIDQIREKENNRCTELSEDYLSVLQLLSDSPDNGQFHSVHTPFNNISRSVEKYIDKSKFQLKNSFPFERQVTGRKDRQVIAAGIILLIGIVAVGTLWYSHSELAQISIDADRNANLYAVQKLQETEVRSKINKRALEAMMNNLAHLGDRIKRLELATILDKLTDTNDYIETSIRRLLSRLQTVAQLRLDPGFLHVFQFSKKLQKIQSQLHQHNYQLAIRHVRDVFKISISYLLFKNGKLRIFVHLPMYKQGTLLEVWKFHNVPYTPVAQPKNTNTPVMMQLEVRETILAIDNTQTLLKLMSTQELAECNRFDTLYFCDNKSIYEKATQHACLFTLFTKEVSAVKRNCHFQLINYRPISIQLNDTSFIIDHSVTEEKAEVQCVTGEETSITLKGRQIINLRPGCWLNTKEARFESSLLVSGAPEKLVLKSLQMHDVLTVEEQYVLNNFQDIANTLDWDKLAVGVSTSDVINGYKSRLVTQTMSISFGVAIVILLIPILWLLWRRWMHVRKRQRQNAAAVNEDPPEQPEQIPLQEQ